MPPRSRAQTARSPRRDPYDRRGNTGGPPNEIDVNDAHTLLEALRGSRAGLGDDFRDTAPWDHYSPGYDPVRIIRILTALQTLIPEEITRWENSVSPSTAREMWKSLLFSYHCRACERRCHTCRTLADALGYERVGGRRAWRRRTEDQKVTSAGKDNSSPQAVSPT